MARRFWRNLDYPLLAALLILSAYGVVMIYSATLGTLGVEDAARRQFVYAIVGVVLLFITASIDYRLWDLVQQPLPILTPLLLSWGNIALILTWRLRQMSTMGGTPIALLSRSDLPLFAMALMAMMLVFMLDRSWIRQINLGLQRAGIAAMVFGVAVSLAWLSSRLGSANLLHWVPYLITGSLAVLYLLDCLTLRFCDQLQNGLYALILILLSIVLVSGQVAGGAKSWLGAGAVQPSELSKILIIIVLAKYLADHEEEVQRIKVVLISLGMVGIPALLVYLQPDLGMVLIMIAIWLVMMWVARVRVAHLLSLAVAGVAALPLIWVNLEEYMRRRLLLFINPAHDPDSYFNVYQALVSIGSGGWTGKGFTRGTQSQLHFLRVRHTDFIFAVTAEELGFLGAVAMMLLIFALLWRTIRVAEQARDTFGRLVASGVAGVILFQSVVNIGMNLGLLPVTGIPLPFVSYGGSSLLTLMLAMGLVESIAVRRKKLEFV